ncbi:TPA: alpha-N-arabinofuranosidase, partial [Candidatus Sumerlaeota bacterium]|nr:alpha-N-arabinofuranosidase [Candidatus Sumerlaeota bacterium]
MWNLWGYTSTDGFGAKEFFDYCEDIKAEPLYVINCGMSFWEQDHQDDGLKVNLDEYLQDALDIIEYANGPVDSKWGAVRAKAGHPKPYNLKYMEIGNEEG